MTATAMVVRMTFEFTGAEQEAIARAGGIRGPLTPGVCAAWVAMAVEHALREALREAPHESDTGSPGATEPAGATSAEVPRV
jgi:hypothetical protein